MSLFIANLAFGESPALETAKVGLLAASVLSAMAGAVVLVKRVRSRGRAAAVKPKLQCVHFVGI
jgi:Na+/H+ antiporter NhaA